MKHRLAKKWKISPNMYVNLNPNLAATIGTKKLPILWLISKRVTQIPIFSESISYCVISQIVKKGVIDSGIELTIFDWETTLIFLSCWKISNHCFTLLKIISLLSLILRWFTSFGSLIKDSGIKEIEVTTITTQRGFFASFSLVNWFHLIKSSVRISQNEMKFLTC